MTMGKTTEGRKVSRRTAIKAETAAQPHTLADLVALQTERRRLNASIEALPDDEAGERQATAIGDTANNISLTITEADIPTVPAVLVQLQEAMEYYADSVLPRDTIKGLAQRLSGLVAQDAPAGFAAPDPLIALAIEKEAAFLACYPPEPIGDRDDATGDKLFDELARIEGRIAATPAITFAGVVVRLRLVLGGLAPDGEVMKRDEPLCRAVIEDIERLATAGAHNTERSVVDLEAEMLRYRNKVDAGGLPEDEAKKLGDKWGALVKEIATAPANTLPDLAAKLRTLEWVVANWGDQFPECEEMARSAREDAERLEGGAS